MPSELLALAEQLEIGACIGQARRAMERGAEVLRQLAIRRPFIVEVDGFEGESAGIEVRGGRVLYCIGVQDEQDGVIRFVDYGYRSIAEARAAWPEAAHG